VSKLLLHISLKVLSDALSVTIFIFCRSTVVRTLIVASPVHGNDWFKETKLLLFLSRVLTKRLMKPFIGAFAKMVKSDY